jgi:hypothetical protein
MEMRSRFSCSVPALSVRWCMCVRVQLGQYRTARCSQYSPQRFEHMSIICEKLYSKKTYCTGLVNGLLSVALTRVASNGSSDSEP